MVGPGPLIGWTQCECVQTRPGPSTGVVSRPGLGGTVIHQDRTGDLFDYYVSDTDTCDSGDDDNNNNNNDNVVGLDDNKGDDKDDLDYTECSKSKVPKVRFCCTHRYTFIWSFMGPNFSQIWSILCCSTSV